MGTESHLETKKKVYAQEKWRKEFRKLWRGV